MGGVDSCARLAEGTVHIIGSVEAHEALFLYSSAVESSTQGALVSILLVYSKFIALNEFSMNALPEGFCCNNLFVIRVTVEQFEMHFFQPIFTVGLRVTAYTSALSVCNRQRNGNDLCVLY